MLIDIDYMDIERLIDDVICCLEDDFPDTVINILRIKSVIHGRFNYMAYGIKKERSEDDGT